MKDGDGNGGDADDGDVRLSADGAGGGRGCGCVGAVLITASGVAHGCTMHPFMRALSRTSISPQPFVSHPYPLCI